MLGTYGSFRSGAFALAAASLLAGCATQAPGEVDESATTIEGVVHVERTLGDEGTSTSVSAKFMRLVPGDEAAAEDLVGSRVILPARGECVLASSLTAGSVDPLKGSVELVDVGDLTLSSPTSAEQGEGHSRVAVELSPRAFADVGDIASGVFYTSPDSTLDLPVPARYVISGTGASWVEPFSIDIDAPDAPVRVRIDGRLLGGSPDASDAPSIEAGRDAVLDWDDGSAAATTDTSETVYVDVQGLASYRCAFADSGSATLPADVLREATSGAADGASRHSLSISVHRVRDREVKVDLSDREGEERALVRFDIARSGKVTVGRR